MDGKYDGYVPGLACPAHGGPPKPAPIPKASGWDIESAQEQIRSCGYKCKAGPVEMNVAYLWIVEEITRLRRERDEWHKDRDRVLKDQMPWMEMVEAVYPDKELDFGEALALIIKERDEWGGLLDEIASLESDGSDGEALAMTLGEIDHILAKRKGK